MEQNTDITTGSEKRKILKEAAKRGALFFAIIALLGMAATALAPMLFQVTPASAALAAGAYATGYGAALWPKR